MKRVMLVYGTRPEAIKMAPLIKAIQAHRDMETVVTVTGQHREMLDQVNDLFGIEPDQDLDLMVPGASLTDLASRALGAIGRAVGDVRPDAVVVQGDTTSAMVAALAAFYQGVPVVHLEAGLRTGDMAAPFPEEANRRLVAPLAALHLAPTATSRQNLLREAISGRDVAVTGNTVIDALHQAVDLPVVFTDPAVSDLVASGDRFVLVTAHRRESWDGPMGQAMSGLRRVAEDHPDVGFLIPMHRNPVVRSVITAALEGMTNVVLSEPLDYHQFTHCMAGSHLLLTDSGGVQEEAPSLGKPVLVMRETTERPEAVDAGTVRLVGTDEQTVHSEVTRLLDDDDHYSQMAAAVNPYGDGRAADRCLAAIAQFLGVGQRLADFDPSHPESE